MAFFPDYKRIIAIEPDSVNADKLRRRVEQEGISNLEIVQKGLGSKRGEVHFKANGESNSFLDETGEQVIQITTLDELINEDPGSYGNIFLKMDIEGSELEALHGAKNLILTHTPVMSICVYHKEEDLIEIPQFIHGLVGDNVYDFYLGFHGLDLAELSFYAIPKECHHDSDN